MIPYTTPLSVLFRFAFAFAHLLSKNAQFAAESGDGDDSLRRGRPRYKEIDYHELAFLEKIGSGAFGTVWRVRTLAIARLCACVCVCGGACLVRVWLTLYVLDTGGVAGRAGGHQDPARQ